MSSGSESEDSSDKEKEKYKNDHYKSPSKKKRQKKGTVNKVRRNYCFEIPLLESDSQKFTEVSFLDLVAKDDVKMKKANTLNGAGAAGLDPHASDDEDALKALAAKYEAKYAEPAGKKTKKRKLEYDDIGEGYDESDPFIDNSECFDEVVPQEMTTAHGGFYINTGSLEFKANDKAVFELSSDEEDNEDKKEKNPKKGPKKKVQFTEGGKEIKLKKAKVIVTDVKRKARIINTDKNKRGPKVINTESKKSETNGKTDVKNVENSKEKISEESVPKPPEIIDLEAQLNALSNASDLSKNESSTTAKNTSSAKTSKSNGNGNIPKSTVSAIKQKTPPVSSPVVTLAQKNTPVIPKSEVKMTLVANSPKTTKTGPQRGNPPKTSQTATQKTSVKPTTTASSPPKPGWQNQVTFPPNLDVTISSVNSSTSLAKLPGGVSVTTVSTTVNCASRPAMDLTVSSQEQRSTLVISPSSVSVDKSNPASPLISTGLNLSQSSKAVESAYSRIIGGNTSVSPALGDKQPRPGPDKLTAGVGNKSSTAAAAAHKPTPSSVSNKPVTTTISNNSTTNLGNKTSSSLRGKASAKLGNSQTGSTNMYQHDPANILSGSPDMSSILGTTAPYFQQKLLQQKPSNPATPPLVVTSATGAPKSSPAVGSQSGYYTSPSKSSEPATRFTSPSQNSPVPAATKTTAQQKAEQNQSSMLGSDISQQIGRQAAAKLYQQQMGGDRSPTSTSRSTPDQSKKVSSSSNQKQSQAPSTNLKQPQPNTRQTAASMSLTPDMTNNLLRNAESLLNNMQQQTTSPTQSQQAAYLAYQQHLASNSQKKAGGGYDINNLLNTQPAITAQQQPNSRTSPNIRTNNTAASMAASTALLQQQQQQQQQQSYFYNNFAFQ